MKCPKCGSEKIKVSGDFVISFNRPLAHTYECDCGNDFNTFDLIREEKRKNRLDNVLKHFENCTIETNKDNYCDVMAYSKKGLVFFTNYDSEIVLAKTCNDELFEIDTLSLNTVESLLKDLGVME